MHLPVTSQKKLFAVCLHLYFFVFISLWLTSQLCYTFTVSGFVFMNVVLHVIAGST